MAIDQREYTPFLDSVLASPMDTNLWSVSVISKHQNDRVSYAGLDTRSNALARGLESVGVKRGDRVAIMLGNSMEFAVVHWSLYYRKSRGLIDTRQLMPYLSLVLYWYEFLLTITGDCSF